MSIEEDVEEDVINEDGIVLNGSRLIKLMMMEFKKKVLRLEWCSQCCKNTG